MMAKRRNSAANPPSIALLAWDAQCVIGLRMMKIAAGGAVGYREAQRMVTEKLMSQMELQTRFAAALMLGNQQTYAKTAVRHYRSKVGANRRRLTRRK